jgi:hypothetical protein
MLFELGVTLADSLTVHPEAIPTTLARRRRPRPAACKNPTATGLYRRVGAAGGGATTLFVRGSRASRDCAPYGLPRFEKPHRRLDQTGPRLSGNPRSAPGGR